MKEQLKARGFICGSANPVSYANLATLYDGIFKLIDPLQNYLFRARVIFKSFNVMQTTRSASGRHKRSAVTTEC